jgi:hypothetical protein
MTTVTYPKSMPDDYRRNLYDLESIIEWGQYYPDDEGTEKFHVQMQPARAELIEARLKATPRNILIIQTKHGRFQIDAGDVLTITCLDAYTGLSVRPTSGNVIEVRNF